ncbi:MAG: hypothetical protein NTX50_23045 [Candidatus Sumerlaeota bacterium]|nr:hypothetical protein [Candidatus Sumerlaeota bacterium]
MRLILSGEGKTDLGTCENIHDSIDSLCRCDCSKCCKFQPGPLAVLADKLLEQHLNYSLLDFSSVCFISIHFLARHKSIVAELPDCAALENYPAHEQSPRSPKRLVEKELGYKPSFTELSDMVRDGRINPFGIDMPSYNAFKQRLQDAVQ